MGREKQTRIDSINKTRDSDYVLQDNIVTNRDVGKIKPKYKEITNYVRENDYVHDLDRNVKYYTHQRKRLFNYQE